MKYLYLSILALLVSFSSFAIGPITGPDSVCVGSSITLSDATPGGTWTSTNTNVALIGSSSGVVNAANFGYTTITYYAGGSSVTMTVTVNPLPTVFNMTSSGGNCLATGGDTLGLNGSTIGINYQLYLGGAALLSPISGNGYPLSFGVQTGVGSYSVAAVGANACLSVMNGVTLHTPPTAFSLTGGGAYCAGGGGVPLNLSGSTVGIRYQSYTGAVPVGAPVYGTGAAINLGPYTTAGAYVAVATDTASGCITAMTGYPSVVIDPLPTAYTCSGGGVFCAGSNEVWFSQNASTPSIVYQLYGPGGATGPAVLGTGGAINFDSVIAAGTYSVLATNSATGCAAWMTDTVVVILNPALAPISGITTICGGSTTHLSDATTGGIWSQSNATVASVNSAGLVTGGAVATVSTTVVTYSVTTGYGCVASATVTVDPSPAPITGPTSVCAGGTITLSDAITGGTWSTSNTSIASITPGPGAGGGVLYPDALITSGTVNAIYTSSTGCFATTTITINSLPSPILGASSICAYSTTTMSDATAGGAWSVSAGPVATINLITGILVGGCCGGTTLIDYTLPTGCMSSTSVTVYATPAAISGPTSVCVGSSITLSDATVAGTWSSSSTPAVATLVPGAGVGTVTGGSAGSTVISFTSPTGCYATTTITVNSLPSPIWGASSICVGSSITMSNTVAGGTWSSNNPAVASVGPLNGIVYGGSVGSTIINYTLSTGCMSSTSVAVNAPPANISGPTSVCVGGTVTLSDAITGGTWSTSNSVVAPINLTSGTLTGYLAGVATISYITGAGCSTTISFTVNPTPSLIWGASGLCTGSTITLSNSISGGTWSSSITTAATINPAGVVTGVAGGSTDIMYTLGTGCMSSTSLAVGAVPNVIISASPGDTVCSGTSVVFHSALSGGTVPSYDWLINGTNVGTADSFVYAPSSGDVLNCIISNTSTCSGTTTVTVSNNLTMVVNPLPTITAAGAASCGGGYNLTAGGAGTGGTYTWSPTTGLSCVPCSASVATISGNTNYTVTGTDASGCVHTATVSLAGNRISGFITATTTPTDTLNVWLIQYNPTDSLITAQDSMIACMDGGAPYYEFDNKPTGSYMVKTALLNGVVGSSGYIPTYGLSSSVWNTATTITHTTATDSLHINMIYGTVPPGPGFISGNVYSGAGRNTNTDVPVVNMVIYLEDATGAVLTYVYTDINGGYTFSGLAYDNYIIYPENYSYYTTPSPIINLNVSNPSAGGIDFKQHTTFGTITPIDVTGIKTVSNSNTVSIFPNPANGNFTIQWAGQERGNATISVSDLLGRAVYNAVLPISTANGQSPLDLTGLNDGVYLITIKSDNIYYSGKVIKTLNP